jgi:hypothetical protein
MYADLKERDEQLEAFRAADEALRNAGAPERERPKIVDMSESEKAAFRDEVVRAFLQVKR